MSERIHNVALESQTVRADGGHDVNSLSDRVRSLRLPDQPRAATRRGSWLPWILCLLLAGSTAAFGYLAWDRSEPAETKPTENVVVQSAPAQPPSTTAASGDVALESKGNIVPVHQIQVSPKVSGMVEKLFI